MNQPMEWALSINYLRQVADQLTEMGIDVAPWLASHELSLADLEQADTSVPWEVVRALFLEAEAITGESALGLMVGERLRINNHGMVGYAAMNSGSVRQVVELLERNPNPTPDEVRHGLDGNLCRCTGYQNIVRATLAAAEAAGG